MDKKGDTSQVFIYAITAVVAVMILLFGYKALGSIFKAQEDTANLQFKDAITNAVDKSSTFGKIDVLTFEIPGKYNILCFLGKDFTGNDEFKKDYPQAEDLKDSTDNVFIGDPDGNIDPFEVDAFEIGGNPKYDGVDSQGVLCFEAADGSVEIKFEGKGSKTKISAP